MRRPVYRPRWVTVAAWVLVGWVPLAAMFGAGWVAHSQPVRVVHSAPLASNVTCVKVNTTGYYWSPGEAVGGVICDMSRKPGR